MAQSMLMDEALTRHRVAHGFTSVPGAGHGLGNLDKTAIGGIHEQAIAFMKRYTA